MVAINEGRAEMTHLINIAVHGTKQRDLQATTTHLQRLNGGFQLATVEAQLLLAFGMKDLGRRAGYVPKRIVDFALFRLVNRPHHTLPPHPVAAIRNTHDQMVARLKGESS
jgi:hypothetical protein